jgi:hypothetical protein
VGIGGPAFAAVEKSETVQAAMMDGWMESWEMHFQLICWECVDEKMGREFLS